HRDLPGDVQHALRQRDDRHLGVVAGRRAVGLDVVDRALQAGAIVGTVVGVHVVGGGQLGRGDAAGGLGAQILVGIGQDAAAADTRLRPVVQTLDLAAAVVRG